MFPVEITGSIGMNETKRVSKPLTEQQRLWLSRIEACEVSGLPTSVYAREHGFSAQALYNWKSRLSKLGMLSDVARSAPFHAVRVVAERPLHGCRIELPNGVRVEVPTGSDPAWLGQVLAVAGTLA